MTFGKWTPHPPQAVPLPPLGKANADRNLCVKRKGKKKKMIKGFVRFKPN